MASTFERSPPCDSTVHPGFKIRFVGQFRRPRKSRAPSWTNLPENAMRNVVALGLAVGLGLSSISAQAIPFSPQPIIGNSMVSEAKFDCGPGGTRGPYG